MLVSVDFICMMWVLYVYISVCYVYEVTSNLLMAKSMSRYSLLFTFYAFVVLGFMCVLWVSKWVLYVCVCSVVFICDYMCLWILYVCVCNVGFIFDYV
jgi:hypothetical protein